MPPAVPGHRATRPTRPSRSRRRLTTDDPSDPPCSPVDRTPEAGGVPDPPQRFDSRLKTKNPMLELADSHPPALPIKPRSPTLMYLKCRAVRAITGQAIKRNCRCGCQGDITGGVFFVRQCISIVTAQYTSEEGPISLYIYSDLYTVSLQQARSGPSSVFWVQSLHPLYCCKDP